ncbi:MAG: aminoglycoside phosphotransferase family protein [Nakamurella sp.]
MTDDKQLTSYLSRWHLSNPQLLTQSVTSRIYTVTHGSQTVVLKLLSSSETEEQRGGLSLRYFDGHGAVRLLQYDQGAQLIEHAAGDELVTLVEGGEDERATRIIADVIIKLHSVPQDAPYDGLVPLERWFDGLFAQAEADRRTGIESIYIRSAEISKQLLADQRDVRVLHGDIHHYNIRQSLRGWLAFDPKGIFGERTYDCANTLCNPGMPQLVHNESRLLANAAILADTLGLELPRLLAFTYTYACLNASRWLPHVDGEEIVRWFLKVAEIIEPHVERV